MLQFKEIQKFNQWWIFLLMIGVGVIPVMGIYQQLILGETFGDKPMSDLGLIAFSLLMFSVPVLFYSIQLKTEITKFDIYLSFFPFASKRVKWEDVKSAEIVTYRFLGYGIKFGSRYGTVYNIKGNKGLALELKNGKKLMIGTQKQLELSEIVDKILKVQP